MTKQGWKGSMVIGQFHGSYIHLRRVQVLAKWFAAMLPQSAAVLDVGCGDGRLAKCIMELRPDITIVGADLFVRPDAVIEVTRFDGLRLPFADQSFTASLLVDVIHHVENQLQTLREVCRVTQHAILVKDHFRQGWAARTTLSFMDRIGNRRHGVDCPEHYLSPMEWDALIEQLGLHVSMRHERLGLYPPPLNWFFERNLHFIDKWVKQASLQQGFQQTA